MGRLVETKPAISLLSKSRDQFDVNKTRVDLEATLDSVINLKKVYKFLCNVD